MLKHLDTKGFLQNVFLDQDTKKKYEETQLIYLLLNLPSKYQSVLDFCRNVRTYIDDFPIGEIDQNLYMVVFNIEDARAYNNFVASKYSKMYSSIFLEKAFRKTDGSFLSAYHVLARTVRRKQELISKFGLKDIDFETAELEELLNVEEETFKYKNFYKETV